MKKFFAIAFLALLFAAPLAADKSSSTIMSAQTTVGPGLATITAASEDPAGGNWFFQLSCRDGDGGLTAACQVVLQRSTDGGTSWTTLHRFTGSDEVYLVSLCGTCIFRAFADEVGSDHTASVFVVVSGSTTVTVTP